MIKDYYAILEIQFGASIDQIRRAYKIQAVRWHPDRNQSEDTLRKMQDINEVYLILKDAEAKSLYDEEYKKYLKHKHSFNSSYSERNKAYSNKEYSKASYEVHDETLKRWMNNAREQASKIVTQSFAEFKVGAEAATKEMFDLFIVYLALGLIFSVIFVLLRFYN